MEKARAEFTRMVRVQILGPYAERRSRDPQKVCVSDFLAFLMERGIVPAHRGDGFVGPTTYTGFFWEEDMDQIEAWFRLRGVEHTDLEKADFVDPPQD